MAGYAEPGEFDSERGTASVYLQSIGESPIQVLVTVRDFAGLNIGGAKSLIDSVPVIVLSDAPRAFAERFRRELERVGATSRCVDADGTKAWPRRPAGVQPVKGGVDLFPG